MVDFKKMTKNKGKKNLLLIQPHSDDILFSASNFLKRRSEFKDVIVLTVEYNEKRLQEDMLMCEEFNLQLMNLEIPISSENFHKEYYSDKKLMSDDSAWEFCLSKIGKKDMKKLENELAQICEVMSDDYLIVTCLGVGHPFHWLVRKLTEQYADLFYRDFPHSYKRRNKDYFVGLTSSRFKLKFTSDINKQNKKDWIKFDLIKKFYKSQSSLLFFEQGYIAKMLPEEYYEKVED